MTNTSPPVRVFTVDEANALLPEVETGIRWFQAHIHGIIELNDAIGVLCMLGAESESSPEHTELRERRLQLDERVQRYQREQHRLHRLGCLIKDIDVGTVDFYAQREGELVFLCWKLGEPGITHWHPIETGFRGRRPMAEF